MAKTNDIIAAARRLAKVPIYEVKAISDTKKVNYVKLSVGHILTDIAANDSTLYNTMEKSFASATAELDQINPVARRWMTQSSGGRHSFGCFWDVSTPFIVYGGKVYSLGGGTLAADFKTAMTQYTAYLLGSDVASGAKTATLASARTGKPAANKALANTTITAIKAGN
jgi:hypothetical protein